MISKNQSESWIWADWPAPDHIRAGTSIRNGGFSREHFASLNLATHVGDDAYNVQKNRDYLADQLSLPSIPKWLNQTHSNRIISLDSNLENLNADGAYSTNKNSICTIMTADCVPILYCDKAGTKITAIHAGWKGICSGIIENAISLYRDPASLLVWIGPSISQKYYEVGIDVYQSCINHLQLSKEAFYQTEIDHWHCDLVNLAKIILKNNNVGAIYECGLCTYKMEELFYSYRRDGVTGRTASMIWMD